MLGRYSITCPMIGRSIRWDIEVEPIGSLDTKITVTLFYGPGSHTNQATIQSNSTDSDAMSFFWSILADGEEILGIPLKPRLGRDDSGTELTIPWGLLREIWHKAARSTYAGRDANLAMLEEHGVKEDVNG